eukprot:gene12563-15786_t
MFQPSADFGRRRSNAELLQEHEEADSFLMLLEAIDSGFQKMEQSDETFITSSGDRKTADDFPCVPIADLLPIRVATLEPGTTHRQRVLRGTIAVKKPTVAAAAGTLLQDEDGNLLWLYNLVPMSHSGNMAARRQNMEAALRMLPQGQALAIIEPFYKVMSDGSLGIHALGRSHDALAAAAAAICLEPHLAKGYYRAALATDALLQHGAAYKLMGAAADAQVEAQSRGGQKEGGRPSHKPR